MKQLVFCLLLVLLLFTSGLADTYTIGCVEDAFLDEVLSTANNGNETNLWVGYGDGDIQLNFRAVLAFDVPFQETWTSDSATLKIRGTTELSVTNYYIYIYTLFREFTESQVTWNVAETGTNWTTAGGDYNTSPKDSFLFNNPNTTYTVKLSSAMSETIETCINNGRLFKIELINKNEGTVNSIKNFSSAEGTQPCTLFIYGATAVSGGGQTGSPATPNASMVYDGSVNISVYAMDFTFLNMAVRIPNKDTLVVCWQNGNDTGTTIDGLVYAWSSDSGATWSVPKQISSLTTVRGSMIAVGDTVYVAVAGWGTYTHTTVQVYKFVPGGSATLVGSGTATGVSPNMTYQNGDTFWLAYTRYNTTATSTARCSLWVDYSTNRCVNWTNSLKRVLGSRTTYNGRIQIVHTSGKRIIIVTSANVAGANRNLTLHRRNDVDGLTIWKNAVDVDTNIYGHWAGACLTPLDSNVIIHYVQNNYDSTLVKTWRHSDSSLSSQTKVWDATGWAAGKSLNFCDIGYAGDTIFAIVRAQATGITDAGYAHIIQFKKSVDGTTWIDSTRIIEPPENAFDAVFKKTSSTFTDYTVAANNNTGNDLSFFAATTDTLFFGYSAKYNYITFVGGTSQANGAQVLSWQYWNGSSWTALTLGLSEPSQDSFFTTASNLGSHQVWFVAPETWATTTVNGVSDKYWIKLSTSEVWSSAIVRNSVSSCIIQTSAHVVKQNPSTYLGIAYVRGAAQTGNTADIMFAKYLLPAPPPGGAVKNARRERLIRIGAIDEKADSSLAYTTDD